MSQPLLTVLISAGVGIAVPLLIFWLLVLISGPHVVVVPKPEREDTDAH